MLHTIVTGVVLILKGLFWLSVVYMYLLGLVTTIIKTYFVEKEAHFKRLVHEDIKDNKFVSEHTKFVAPLQ